MFSKRIHRDLEVILGRTPHLVRENLKYLSYDDVQKHFTCFFCLVKITSVNDSEEVITKTLNEHLSSTKHIQKTFPTSTMREKLIAAFNGKVPQIVKDNVHVISLIGDDYFCTICEELIETSVNLCQTRTKLTCHLELKSHEANMEKYIKVLRKVYNIYGGIPNIVINQSEHLKKISNVSYQCTACDNLLRVNPNDREETEKEFTNHLNSESHQRNAQQAKAYSLVPELEYFFPDVLPNYMLRNAEYISVNGEDFFCSLCSSNISCSKDAFETKHNFRAHFLLTDHEKKLRNRMDLNNEAFSMLEPLFRGFPLNIVVDHLKYISFVENNFGCNICSEVIVDSDKEDNAVKEALSTHCASSDHKSNIQCNDEQQSEILQDLNNLYGVVPKSIKDNIKHIIFKEGVNFECTLCNKTLKSKKNRNYIINTTSTKDNFESHLNSPEHINGLETLDCLENEVKKELKRIYPYLPQFILNNIQHLGFNDGTRDYHCYLCDKSIAVLMDRNKSELTERNLRSHLLSEDHIKQLKYQANVEADTLFELESVFFKVPNVVLTGVEHLELQDDSYYCNLCKVSMKRSTGFLWTHFHGRNHRSLLEELEDECTEAFYQLDKRFWRVPESVLRSIDFLMPVGNDLFCKLCQENLPLDKNNLEVTRSFLKGHMDSKVHKSNLKGN